MRPKIYLFGDSITEESFEDGGWGSSLANHFSRTADVVLRGYNGYNTRWALMAKEMVFPLAENGVAPLAVVVFFGANDASLLDRCRGSLHVPIDEYKKNLGAIVGFLKIQWPSTRVILITPPPIDEDARLQDPSVDSVSGLPERTNEAAGAYAKQCLKVASECGVLAVDLWTKMQQIPGWQKTYLRDGLHLDAEGSAIVFEEMIGVLRKYGISVETLPVDLPLINEMDRDDPLKSFDDLTSSTSATYSSWYFQYM